jgi:hypothetical protein
LSDEKEYTGFLDGKEYTLPERNFTPKDKKLKNHPVYKGKKKTNRASSIRRRRERPTIGGLGADAFGAAVNDAERFAEELRRTNETDGSGTPGEGGFLSAMAMPLVAGAGAFIANIIAANR